MVAIAHSRQTIINMRKGSSWIVIVLALIMINLEDLKILLFQATKKKYQSKSVHLFRSLTIRQFLHLETLNVLHKIFANEY